MHSHKAAAICYHEANVVSVVLPLTVGAFIMTQTCPKINAQVLQEQHSFSSSQKSEWLNAAQMTFRDEKKGLLFP